MIHYAEEQNFLINYIFTKKKTVDNVWIGAKYIGNKQYQWEDHTVVKVYTNWATGNPKNLADHCVQMTPDEPKGKWTDEPCARRNMVICQRQQPFSIKLLTETVIELKHSLLQTASKLEATKAELNEAKNRLSKTEESVTQLKKGNIPIGFTYVQLPKDKAPSELWPSMTWTDISKEYEGVFFRVVGGGASGFGAVQPQNAPRLEVVHTSYDDSKSGENHGINYARDVPLPVTGWSDGIWSGDVGDRAIYIRFKHTDIPEVRPKNMAIKVFKRTA